jgi:hypothetical protein
MSLQQVGLMIVINTSPAINLGRALGTLEVVAELYGRDTKRVGKVRSVREAIERMKRAGAWLDEAVIQQALRSAGED